MHSFPRVGPYTASYSIFQLTFPLTSIKASISHCGLNLAFMSTSCSLSKEADKHLKEADKHLKEADTTNIVNSSSDMAIKEDNAPPTTILTKVGGNKFTIPKGQPQPLQYSMLNAEAGEKLMRLKIKYLLSARKNHPECGGDPENFLRISLAYQDCLKDYGLESIHGDVVNLGNFQSCTHEAHNYIDARSRIKEYIPLSTLDDHIRQLEAAQSKVSVDMEEKLTGNDTEAMWLLEDIDEITEKEGTDFVTLQLQDGTVGARAATVMEIAGAQQYSRIGPSVKRIADPSVSTSDSESAGTAGKSDVASSTQEKGTPIGQSMDDGGNGGSLSGYDNSAEKDTPLDTATLSEEKVTVTKADIMAMNAKHVFHEGNDIAAMAAQTATTLCHSTNENRENSEHLANLIFMIGILAFIGYAALDAIMRKRTAEKNNPQAKNELSVHTLLPWWGNDGEYESQVKRIFVEEWRTARMSAKRVDTFQKGLTAESMDRSERDKIDVQIFAVTADRLKKMKATADASVGKI